MYICIYVYRHIYISLYVYMNRYIYISIYVKNQTCYLSSLTFDWNVCPPQLPCRTGALPARQLHLGEWPSAGDCG